MVTLAEPISDRRRALRRTMPLATTTGLYYERVRWYSSARAVLRQEPKSRYTSGAVHREISQDPAGSGEANRRSEGAREIGLTPPLVRAFTTTCSQPTMGPIGTIASKGRRANGGGIRTVGWSFRNEQIVHHNF